MLEHEVLLGFKPVAYFRVSQYFIFRSSMLSFWLSMCALNVMLKTWLTQSGSKFFRFVQLKNTFLAVHVNPSSSP